MEDGVMLAVVATKDKRDKISGGGVPVFLADDYQELERMSLLMSRIFKAMVHDLENGIWVLYRQ